MTDTMQAYRWIIAGRVQGVGFRWFTMRRAAECGLAGWVRNLPDGRVEVLAKGPEDSLRILDAALAQGPRLASVENVDKQGVPLEAIEGKSFIVM